MFCQNCSSFNEPGTQTCSKCGNVLVNTNNMNNGMNNNMNNNINNDMNNNMNNNINNDMNNNMNNNINNNINNNMNNNMNNDMNNNMNSNMNNGMNNKSQGLFMTILMLLINIILKPFTTVKEGLNKFDNIKNSAILSVIIAGGTTIINLLITMFNTVRVESFFSDEVTWEFSNLKHIDYVEVIGLNFLIYLGIAFAVAGVFYIASLIVKKQCNFCRMLSISSLAIVPGVLCSLVLSPLLGMISQKLAVLLVFVGLIYSFIIDYEGINYELSLEGNSKFYVNFASLSVLFAAAYFLLLESIF